MIKQIIKYALIALIGFIFILLVLASTIQIISKESILNVYNVKEPKQFGVVLGASVYANKKPSPIYLDRLNVSHNLYMQKKIMKIIISGYRDDKSEYDELEPAKKYLIEKGVPANDIILDFKGNDTFASLVNYKKVYNQEPFYLITQNYHLYRGIFISKLIKLDSIGVNADVNIYKELENFIIREYFANLKILVDYLNYKYEILR